MRKRIFDIIEVAKKNDVASRVYDYFLIAVIAVSLIPIIFRTDQTITIAIDTFALVIFIGDYLLRWATADYRFKSKSPVSFIRYPFSFLAVMDLLVIVALLPISYDGSELGVIQALRVVRVFHVFRLAGYSKSVELIVKVFRRQKDALITVVIFTTFYIFISALIVFTAEPETFPNFFDAIYWATASLTTIGYGDIYTVSDIGRIITIFSSLFGVLVVALPTGIIAAGFMKVFQEQTRASERLATAAAKVAAERAKQAEKEAKNAKKVIKKVVADNIAQENAIKKVAKENLHQESVIKKVEKTLEKWKSL